MTVFVGLNRMLSSVFDIAAQTTITLIKKVIVKIICAKADFTDHNLPPTLFFKYTTAAQFCQ